MDNNLSPEDWMEEVNKKEGSEWSIYDTSLTLMERYANYRRRDLEALILSFRKIFTDIRFDSDLDRWPEVFLETYDKHFGITAERL